MKVLTQSNYQLTIYTKLLINSEVSFSFLLYIMFNNSYFNSLIVFKPAVF